MLSGIWRGGRRVRIHAPRRVKVKGQSERCVQMRDGTVYVCRADGWRRLGVFSAGGWLHRKVERVAD